MKTKNHTRFIYQHIYNFDKLNVVGFINFPLKDEVIEFTIYPEVNINSISEIQYDHILISTHEYFYDAIDLIDGLKLSDRIQFLMYTESSDNIMRHFHSPRYNIVGN